MDQVLLTLGNLFRIYAAAHVDSDTRRCVHASLEKRWKAADQEVFILAVLFNPYVRATCFRDAVLPQNILVEICMRTFARVMRRAADIEFWSACHRYIQSTGRYTSTHMALELHRAMAEREVRLPFFLHVISSVTQRKSVDLVRIWEAIRCEHAKTSAEIADHALVMFAIRILSVVANSGACERCFSCFGITHTAQRNRLAVQSTHDVNLVRMDVESQHAAAGRKPHRLKRKLGPTASSGSLSSQSSQSTSFPTAETQRSEHGSAQDERGDADDPERRAALEQAVLQLFADEDGDGDPTDLDHLEARLQAGESALEPADEFPTALSAHFTKITLCDLFVYPDAGTESSTPLEFYWNGGIRDLEAEEQVMDAAAGPVAST